MNVFLFCLVNGIAVGSIYAIAAMGLTLTYKTSGVFNFAHGAVAAAAAYVFWDLNQSHKVPWPVAALITLAAFGFIAGYLLELLARGLAEVATAQKIVATVGLLLVITSILTLAFGDIPKQLPEFLGSHNHHYGSINFSTASAVKALIAAGSALGLSLFFRRTRTGTAMRAVVDDSPLLDMTGADPVAVRRTSWIIGSSFAAVAGMMIAPQLNVDADLLTLLVVHAFGACAIGRFTSLPLTYAGGLIVGFAEQVVQHFTASHASLSGIYPATSFIILFGVLLFTPRRKLIEVGRAVKSRAPRPSSLPPRARTVLTVAAVLAMVLVPLHFDSIRLTAATTALATVILYLSLSLLIRVSGQVSLCQLGFQAAGAAFFGHVVSHGGIEGFHWGLPWPVAILLGGLFTVPIGLIVAIPAIRLSGIFLGLATLGFGILLQQPGYNLPILFGSSGTIPTPRPTFAGLDGTRGFYYVVLVVVFLSTLVVIAVERSRLGRLLRAMSDSPIALTTTGTSVNVTRVIVFGISSFLAGVSGAVAGGVAQNTNALAFQPIASLALLAILAICGSGTIKPAFVAAFFFTFLPSYSTNTNTGGVLQVGFGLAAIGVALASSGRPAAFFAQRANASAARAGRSPVRSRLPGTVPVEETPRKASPVLTTVSR